LRRVLEYNDYQVKQVMNITDVGHLTEDDLLAADTGEDKIIKAAREERKTPQQIARFYTERFFEDTQKLNILKPHVVCPATEHIPQMIELIKKLERKNYTYLAANHLCFDIAKFKNYGRLSGKKLKELKVGARLEPIPGKRHPYDFSLWIVDPGHLMRWESPWGVGYPGWHIECSAMSMNYLGSTLDIHTGGEDNIFPHHENEIAQSEAATGKKFVRFWVHARFLQVEGQKMSKSLGNVYRIKDLEDRGFDPLAFRYLCLTAHYRTPFNFTWKGLEASQRALEKLRSLVLDLNGKRVNAKARNPSFRSGRKSAEVEEFRKRFLAAINDDLNLPQALAVVWEMIKDKRYKIKDKRELILDWDRVLGLDFARFMVHGSRFTINKETKKLVEKREELRKEGKWEEADEMRKKIEDRGWKVEDTESGPKIKRLIIH